MKLRSVPMPLMIAVLLLMCSSFDVRYGSTVLINKSYCWHRAVRKGRIHDSHQCIVIVKSSREKRSSMIDIKTHMHAD